MLCNWIDSPSKQNQYSVSTVDIVYFSVTENVWVLYFWPHHDGFSFGFDGSYAEPSLHLENNAVEEHELDRVQRGGGELTRTARSV